MRFIVYDEALRECYSLQAEDPYFLDIMDVYSNMLYVLDKKSELALLAQHCVKADKYRPETCSVLGNYYSIKRDHAKAVLVTILKKIYVLINSSTFNVL